MRQPVLQQKPTSSSVSPLVPLVLMSFRRPGIRRYKQQRRGMQSRAPCPEGFRLLTPWDKRPGRRPMSVKMPTPDQSVLDRRDRIVKALRAIVPGEGVIAHESEMRPYESDALTAYRQLPLVVVLPDNVDQVCRVLKYCNAENIKVVPRGAGTSLSGGALPAQDGVLLGMAKFNRIRAIDLENRVVVAGPGVT